MQSSCWMHAFCEKFEVSKNYSHLICKMFANFSLNQTDETPDYNGIWTKYQIIEEMKVTYKLHYRRGWRSWIKRSGRRKIEGLSSIQSVTVLTEMFGFDFLRLLSKTNNLDYFCLPKHSYVYLGNKMAVTHMTDAPLIVCQYNYFKPFFATWSLRPNSSKTGITGRHNWPSRT